MQQGKIGLLTVPNLSINLLAFALTFDPSAAKTLDPNPLNVPGDFFNYVGLRQFLVNAFPYTTVENTIFTTDGIQYGFNYGGAIPQYMGNYYPTNISWPSTDPVTNPATVGSAAWWWAQATTAGTPYYDPELAALHDEQPVPVPDHRAEGAWRGPADPGLPALHQPDIRRAARAQHVRLWFRLRRLCFRRLWTAFPGQSAVPAYNLGWAPDYPDPTDYVAPFYYANRDVHSWVTTFSKRSVRSRARTLDRSRRARPRGCCSGRR